MSHSSNERDFGRQMRIIIICFSAYIYYLYNTIFSKILINFTKSFCYWILDKKTELVQNPEESTESERYNFGWYSRGRKNVFFLKNFFLFFFFREKTFLFPPSAPENAFCKKRFFFQEKETFFLPREYQPFFLFMECRCCWLMQISYHLNSLSPKVFSSAGKQNHILGWKFRIACVMAWNLCCVILFWHYSTRATYIQFSNFHFSVMLVHLSLIFMQISSVIPPFIFESLSK